MGAKELIAFVEAMDCCWVERRFGDLGAYFDAEITVTAPNGSKVNGAAAVIESYREFVDRAQVHAFEPFDWDVAEQGDTAVVQYGWRMRWSSGGETHAAEGREVLALAHREGRWRIVSRMQLQA